MPAPQRKPKEDRPPMPRWQPIRRVPDPNGDDDPKVIPFPVRIPPSDPGETPQRD